MTQPTQMVRLGSLSLPWKWAFSNADCRDSAARATQLLSRASISMALLTIATADATAVSFEEIAKRISTNDWPSKSFSSTTVETETPLTSALHAHPKAWEKPGCATDAGKARS